MFRLRNVGLAAVLSLFTVLPAQAGTLTYTMTGALTGVQDDPASILSGVFSVGDLVTLSISVDTAAIDQVPVDPEVGVYAGATFQLTVGGLGWVGQAEQRIINRADGDYYSIINEVGFAGANFGPLIPETFFMQLIDSLGTLMSSDALMASVPNLADFDSQNNGIRLGDPSNSNLFGVLRFEIDNVSAVPVPAGLWLMLSSLAGLAALRKRRAT